MPRNSSGTYTLPESPFVPSTPISSAAVNSDFDDIQDALTDSLSRSGDGGMQAALPLNVDGFFYSGDTNTGMSRPSADTQVITCGGVDVIEVTPTGASILNLPLIPQPVGLMSMWSGTTAPTGWVLTGATYSRATYAALWAFAQAQIALGNTLYGAGDGATTFTIATMDGYVPAGVDAAGTRIASFTDVGDTAGAATVTLAANQIPAGVPSSNGAQSISVSTSPHEVYAGSADIISSGNDGGSAGQFNTPLATTHAIRTFTSNNSISVTSTNASQQTTPIVQPSRAVKFIIYAGA